jgi:hypothetical protein
VEEPARRRAVTLHVQGRDFAGAAEATTDEGEVARVLEMMLREYKSYARYVGLKPKDRADRTQIERVTRERIAIRARPEREEKSSDRV